jgi:5-methyltetrahydrofolate--homocysteine methyltransferase
MAIEDIFQAVVRFDQASVIELVQNEIDNGTPADDVLNNGLIAALGEVGKKFSAGELFVPEMLMAAQAMKGGVDLLKPLLTDEIASAKGTVVIGTVKGDLHDIGKNLVIIMMEGAGFNVVDMGVDVDAGQFVTAVREHNADIVALSALLTTTMAVMETTVQAIKETDLAVHTIVGGAPVTRDFADRIGADGYGEDAHNAVEIATSLLSA